MAKRITPNNKMTASISNKTDVHISPVFTNIWSALLTLAVIIFIFSLSNSMDNILEKWAGLSASIITLLLLVLSKRSAKLKNYTTPLFFSVLAYFIWGGISTFYAASGKFAIFEFSKLLVALCVFISVLFFTDRDQWGFKKISYLIASTGCFFGVLSVDAASFGILSGIYKSVLGQFTSNFDANIMYEQGIRITGIFGNPNTYAGFMAVAVFFSLYLAFNASDRRESIISKSLLALNSLAYLLAFSLGSLFMFLVACLIMIATTEKGSKVSLSILMFETAATTFIFAFIAMIGLGKNGFISLAPDLALVFNAFFLYLLDDRLRPVLCTKLNANTRILLVFVFSIVILVSGFIITAFSISSDLSLAANSSIMRAVYIPGGEYELQADSTSPVNISIESQNDYDLMRHTSTILYSGTNDQQMLFKVPNDSKIVKINFSSTEIEAKITDARYSGAEKGNVHLGYPLLPEFIANRTQDLFANENVVQRTIFFKDGLELFAKSPIIGRGLGGFENGVYSVQDFYYETKYAHNHYIQALSDLGIVGLVLFLSILIFSITSIVKAKRNARSLYAIPVLAACAVQIFGQALTDAVWSTGVFLGFSAAILALVAIFCSEPFNLKGSFNEDRLRITEKAVLIVFTGVFVLLLSGNLYAQAHAKAGVKDFNEIKQLILIDRFENNDYKLSYLVNAPLSNSDEILPQAHKYAEELMRVESNSLAPYIMSFKFKTFYDIDAFNAAAFGIKNNKSNPKMWRQVFDTLEEYIDPVGPNVDDAAERLRKSEEYVADVLDIYNLLLERNQNSLDDIMLTPYNNAFIGKLLEIQATNLYDLDWVFTAVMTYAFDSDCAVDANQDGLPDDFIIRSGEIKRLDNGNLAISEGTVLELSLYHKLHGKYTFNIESGQSLQGITIALNDSNQNIFYDNNNAYTQIDLADNSTRELSKFTLTFPTATEIENITFTTELEK